jgi:hypothetical protein
MAGSCGWCPTCSRPGTWRTGGGMPRCPVRHKGGIASPVLSNIYLDRLDTFVEQTLLPEYNRGDRRRRNRAYEVVDDQIAKARRQGDRQTARTLVQRRRRLPSQDPNDPAYRRLRYVRYCDDWLLGFAGPRHEAEQIKTRIGAFLRDQLKLELSESAKPPTNACLRMRMCSRARRSCVSNRSQAQHPAEDWR